MKRTYLEERNILGRRTSNETTNGNIFNEMNFSCDYMCRNCTVCTHFFCYDALLTLVQMT